jgi:hypothetical protein
LLFFLEQCHDRFGYYEGVVGRGDVVDMGIDTHIVFIGASDPGEGVCCKRCAVGLSEMASVSLNNCVLDSFAGVDDFCSSLCDRGSGVRVDVGGLRHDLNFRQ